MDKAEERAREIMDKKLRGKTIRELGECLEPIIAQAIREAVEEEREACAKMAYNMRGRRCPFSDGALPGVEPEDPCPVCGGLGTFDAEDKCMETPGMAIAAAIRARGKP